MWVVLQVPPPVKPLAQGRLAQRLRVLVLTLEDATPAHTKILNVESFYQCVQVRHAYSLMAASKGKCSDASARAFALIRRREESASPALSKDALSTRKEQRR